MFGKRFNVAVTIALVALLLPRTGAASERPTLLSHVTSPPVRDMPPQAHHGGELEEKERHRPPAGSTASRGRYTGSGAIGAVHDPKTILSGD